MPNSDYVLHVCRNGEGPAQCRYLTPVRDSTGQFACAKLNPATKGRIDDLIASGSSKVTGRADNCDGQP